MSKTNIKIICQTNASCSYSLLYVYMNTVESIVHVKRMIYVILKESTHGLCLVRVDPMIFIVFSAKFISAKFNFHGGSGQAI